MPDLFFTADEQKTIDTYSTDLSKYISENGAKFMTGEKKLTDYASFVDGFKQLHLDDIIKVYQTAYDRWSASQK